MLHLTNGDCAIPALRAAGVDEEILPWREVLHDGPVPGRLDAGELRAVRGRFLGDERPLREQDERLDAAVAEGEELMLWFEADLFDLLLLLQIVERLPLDARARLVLVGQERWRSVTEVEPDELASLGEEAPELSAEQRELAWTAWEAFRSGTPASLEPFAAGTPALPAVGQALHRLLEELPWSDTGLSRTERQLLGALADRSQTREAAFQAAIAAEERPFLGDGSAWATLDRLAPLLDGQAVNARGRAVLAGAEEWEPRDQRWIGGTRLPPGRSPWHWDPEASRVTW
ncbi:MAG TPA: hypothetical protein VF056_04825 [Thermoleophilaceae bacterium]